MRLIGSGLFIIIGLLAGIALSALFDEKGAGYLPNMIVGVAGAFAGLFFKDIFDIDFAGNLGGAVIFSLLGACVLLIPLNLAYQSLFGEDD
ncbi:MAG: GlsB/YeaQ/YmgE family stress response membrane protein [Gammaproteobacteria bacterium]|nr:GlsB/YeaQ/YmgE family stress response membrane protein [Gammaproteobacteria bacterium]